MNTKIHDWKKLGLQSGDLILCAGNGKMSKRIAKVQQYTGAPKEFAKFTHVAGITKYRHSPDKNNLGNALMVEESTTLNEYSGKRGVQRDFLIPWLPNYNGEVYVRKLDFYRHLDFYDKDEWFWNNHKDDDYESGIPGGLEMLLCALRLHRFIPWYTPMATKEIHCTELIAKRLDHHKLWNRVIVPNRMPPWVWCALIDKWLNCPIGQLIRIK
jgi:hypothetical protein